MYHNTLTNDSPIYNIIYMYIYNNIKNIRDPKKTEMGRGTSKNRRRKKE